MTIVRVWRGKTSMETAAPYVEHLQTAVFPELDGIDGFAGSEILRRDVTDGVEFVVITRWESMDAIHAFAGDDPERAVVPPDAQALLVEWDGVVRHFESGAS